MKLPISWLKEYVDVSVSAERLEELLTMSGSKVECLEKKGDQTVIEIEVTTNRPDTLSILGLAREVSALTGKKIRRPKGYEAKAPIKSHGKFFDIFVEDKKACPKYTARLIQDVSVKSSPQKAQNFLSLADARPVTNIVDATNYVLFECGQPLHAFDYDKIEGKKIEVRFSKKGEKFLAIDGIEHELDGQTLVIADAAKPIAIAGVMGGKLTEVTASTKNILLESAYFDPALVRQASRRYKISTESSYRFERGVDTEYVEKASHRALGLIQEWSGGQDSSGLVVKNYLKSTKNPSINLRLNRLEKLLGMKVSSSRAASILKALGLEVKTGRADQITVKTASFRRDLVQEADLIEEILRIEGFDKIPAVIPQTRYGKQRAENPNSLKIKEIKKWMAALGFQEIITYSLLSSKVLREAGFNPEKTHKIVNAVSAEQQYFRPSLCAGMLQAALFNVNRKVSSIRFFELGNRYVGGKEETVLGVLLSGFTENHWQRKIEASFYDLKGVVSNFLISLGVSEVEQEERELFQPLSQAETILWRGKQVALLGPVSDTVQKNFDLPKSVFYAEIFLDEIFSEKSDLKKVKAVSKFPAVKRDIAFIVSDGVKVSDLEKTMKRVSSGFLKETHLFDQYIGKNIASGKRSLAFSLWYQKDTGTFTEEEIAGIQKQVGEALKSEYQAEFR